MNGGRAAGQPCGPGEAAWLDACADAAHRLSASLPPDAAGRAAACLALASLDFAAGHGYRGLAMTGRAWVTLSQQAADARSDAVRVYNADFPEHERAVRVRAAEAAARRARAASDQAGALLDMAASGYRPRDREGTPVRPGDVVDFAGDDGTVSAGLVVGPVTRGQVIAPGRLLVTAGGRPAAGGMLSPLGLAAEVAAGIRAVNPPPGSGRHFFHAGAAADALDRAAALYRGGQEADGSAELAIALLRATAARDKARRAVDNPLGREPQQWELEDLDWAEGCLSQVRRLHGTVIGTRLAAGDRTRYLRYAHVDGRVTWCTAHTGGHYLQWIRRAAMSGGTLAEEAEPPPLLARQPRGAQALWDAALGAGVPARFTPGYMSDLVTELTCVTVYHPLAGEVKQTWRGGRLLPGEHTLRQALYLAGGGPPGLPSPPPGR